MTRDSGFAAMRAPNEPALEVIVADLTVRSRQDEQMDAEDLDPAIYEHVLRDLAKVNRWTFTASPVLAWLRRAAEGMQGFRLMDVGFGHGDLLRAVARWATKKGMTADLVGVDLNEKSREIARAATPPDLAIDYRTGDYVDQAGPFDFIVSAQVTHHMTDDQLRDFIRFMEANARGGWMICDLHRHGFAHWGFPILARLMMVHRIVREDGRLSIARSFRPAEWEAIIADAGIDPATVRIVRRFPFRLCVERIR
jgi:2-polyprenyl-3-methyl-5-hydroxy-6-metoxy-1,4-benzoquinol methylase